MSELTARARRVIDTNLYLVLGTADADGNPWTSPVFYAADGYRDFYWVSSPEVLHSANLAVRPRVSMVIFDSTAPVGQGGPRAVHLAGDAAELDDAELEHGLRVFPRAARTRGASVDVGGGDPGRAVPDVPGQGQPGLGAVPGRRRPVRRARAGLRTPGGNRPVAPHCVVRGYRVRWVTAGGPCERRAPWRRRPCPR